MTRFIRIGLTAGILFILQGCTPQCRGDSCERPESKTESLVIWWPADMRVETGHSTEQADHQAVSLKR